VAVLSTIPFKSSPFNREEYISCGFTSVAKKLSCP
jgi:hypothetical protein